MEHSEWVLTGIAGCGLAIVIGCAVSFSQAAGQGDQPEYTTDPVNKTIRLAQHGSQETFPLAYYAHDNAAMSVQGLSPLQGTNTNALGRKEVAFRDPLHKNGIVYLSFDFGTPGFQAVSTDGSSYQLVMNGTFTATDDGGMRTEKKNLVYAQFANKNDYLIGIPEKKPIISCEKLNKLDGADWSHLHYAGFDFHFTFDQGQAYVIYANKFVGDAGTKEKVYERKAGEFPKKNYDPQEFAKVLLKYVPSDDARSSNQKSGKS